MKAEISAIEYHLPERVLDNNELVKSFPEWTPEKIEQKLGIAERHIAREDECSSDLALEAAEKLIARCGLSRDDIDYLLLCTQSPDYLMPTTACILQDRLHLRTGIGALDINLGCSGFVYGLGLAKGLIESGQARNVMLLTAETFSKVMHPRDKSVRTLLGDAAAATLVCAREGDEDLIGPFSVGTDGSGAKHLIIPAGGMRLRRPTMRETRDELGNTRTDSHMFMDGPEIFRFSLRVVCESVQTLLRNASMDISDIDYFVFHQANKYMLEELRTKLAISEDRFCIALRHVGNTGSSTIPIALKEAASDGRLRVGQKVMLVGFGAGFSWAACLIRWNVEYSGAEHTSDQFVTRAPMVASEETSNNQAVKRADAGQFKMQRGCMTGMLLELLSGILNIAIIGPDDSLVGLGIDSVSAMALQERIRNTIGVNVPIARFLGNESVQVFADFLETQLGLANSVSAKPAANVSGGTKWVEGEI